MIPFWNNNNKHGVEDEPNQPEQKPAEGSTTQDDMGTVEDDKFTIPVPPVAEPFYGLKDRLAYFGFSQRGKSHIDSGAPCQDRCFSTYIPENGLLIVAVADGVGSCALSDLGADTAVHSAVEFIHKELQQVNSKKLDSTLAGSVLRNALQYAYNQVELAAQVHEQLLYSLQSTLTVAIYNGADLYFGHAGDDGIVVLTEEGTLAMATTRHKGEEASSVYPLQSKSTWQFGMVPNAVAFVMATDGVLDAFVRSSFEKDRVYYPFIEPIFTAAYENENSVKQICADFFTYMRGDTYRAAVTDDLTISAVINLEKLPHCLPKFDLDAWNEETKQYEDKVRTALYNQKQKSPRERTTKPARTDSVGQADQGGNPHNRTTQANQANVTSPQPVQQSQVTQPARAPQNTQSHQSRHANDSSSGQSACATRNADPNHPRHNGRRPEFQNPYSKHTYCHNPVTEGTHRFDRHGEGNSRYDDGQASRYVRESQNPNGRHDGNAPKGDKPKKRKKIRPQFVVFITILILFLALFVYLGIRLIRIIMSFAWVFGCL